jgi:excisionase family DNA binding protein
MADSRIDGRTLLTVADVADECGVSIWTVKRWIKRRAIDVVYLPGGQMIRIRRSALEKFLASQTHAALPPKR